MTDQPTPASAADALQFDTAEPVHALPAAMACAGCGRALESVYHTVNAKPVCSACRAQLENPPSGSLLRAALMGGAAGFAGWCVYFAILKLANYELAIIAILVGYLVGQGVHRGSAGRGGRRYQVMAVLITYVAITASYLPLLAAEISRKGGSPVAAWMAAEVLALMYPFLSITQSPLGIVILGIGLWQAWKSNQRVQLAITGPHTVAAPAEAEPALA
jgi:hypothetical protein